MNVERSAPRGAVFLSYAREDAAAARRIAEALRGFGLEVWFDMTELRGGDQWDAKIRGQIKACALFLPVISATTQSRDEAYFRLEWKLADDRSHLMAPGKVFIVPVVIDDTGEAGAVVPDSFRRAQWTRLAGGEPTSAFVEQVKRLLETPRRPALQPESARPPTFPPMIKEAVRARKAAMAAAGAPAAKPGIPGWVRVALAVVVVGGAAALYLALKPKSPAGPDTGGSPAEAAHRTAPAAPPASAPAPAAAAAQPPPDSASAKSIAVLPFANLSPDKENGYFCDGVQESILTTIAQVRQLRVVSRTSVEQYRGTTKALPQIARELGVTYVLEGSVQRAGNKVRVTGQLIRAATDEHIWAKSYERDLSDIFAIQSELATAIAAEMEAVLSPAEQSRLRRAPTSNLAAYEAYLQALDIHNRSQFRVEELIKAESLLQTAVELDPKFTAAWHSIAGISFLVYNRLQSRPAERAARLERARQAVATLERLAPDEPETWVTLAAYHANNFDYPRAEEYLQRAAEAVPNNAMVVVLLADMDARHGRYRAALARYRQAFRLDRQDATPRKQLLIFLNHLRRYDEAEAILAEFPDPASQALLRFRRSGDVRELEKQENVADPTVSGGNLAWTTGDAATYVRQVDELRRRQGGARFDSGTESRYALALLVLGETDRAHEQARQALAANPRAYLPLAVLGRKEEALAAVEEQEARLAREGVMPYSMLVVQKAQVLMWSGEKERAIAEIARLLQTPSVLNVHVLRRGVAWRPLQGDPDFEALLHDPKNSAPLL